VCPWLLFGPCFGAWGPVFGPLGSLWVSFGAFGALLGTSLVTLGVFWALLEVLLRVSGNISGSLGHPRATRMGLGVDFCLFWSGFLCFSRWIFIASSIHFKDTLDVSLLDLL